MPIGCHRPQRVEHPILHIGQRANPVVSASPNERLNPVQHGRQQRRCAHHYGERCGWVMPLHELAIDRQHLMSNQPQAKDMKDYR